MNEFRFANLGWIHAIWPVLLIAGLLVVLELRGRLAVDRLLSRIMQQRLVHRTSLTRRITAILLATIAMLLLIVALMRPQWGRSVEQAIRIDSQIMVCLDVSKSMLAEDVAPNRLERAKVELDALLGLMRDGQQVGLIAFAGKATVLSPMTTDFGFLRLVLAEAEPKSVGLGGTKIGLAVQKALDGFREAGDIQRMILLITDGEDHDSFVNDAAERAKQNGVRIVAVGFGDEAGSKIEITDPKTGVRSFLKDRNGKEVTSRLNGKMLRDIALTTEGAYVPAGTGALDLDSIYRNHIETLLSGSLEAEQRVIRNEAFQWFVLAALIFLIMALVSATPRNLRTRALIAAEKLGVETPTASTTVAMLLAMMFVANAAWAQEAPKNTLPAGGQNARSDQPLPDEGKVDADPESAAAEEPPFDETMPPRLIYNAALAYLDSDPDRAELCLNHVRGEAGTDGELRFRALYNLGWVEVNRADAALEAEPEQALQYLHLAANRFREAIRVRPDEIKARQNLEIVSRRILELTDALRKKEPGDLAARLDALIQSTRAHQTELQTLVQQVNREDGNSVESYRSEFDSAAVAERQLISEAQLFSDDARTELDAVTKKPDEEKTPEDRVRAVQLQNMLVYFERSLQRMNKSRSLTRRLQGDSAFRRWAASLSDLKRARDQLRHPVEILGQIVGDTPEMAGLTRMLAAGSLVLPDEPNTNRIPAWLTGEYVTDVTATIQERTGELEEQFLRITAAQEETANAEDTGGPAEDDPQTTRLLENIALATPMLTRAKEHFAQARSQLERSNAYDQALGSQQRGIVELHQAWELFFDIRRLIELIYGQQRLARGAIAQSARNPEIAPQIRAPLLQTETKNLERSARLAELLQSEVDQLPADNAESTAPPASGQATEDTQAAAERDRLERAQMLLEQVRNNLQQAVTHLKDPPSEAEEEAPESEEESGSKDSAEDSTDEQVTDTPKADSPESTDRSEASIPASLQPVAVEIDQSLEALEELRRLFFSLIEHLRDTAQQQADLNDKTATTSGDADEEDLPAEAGPIVMRQQQLQDFTRQIAEALKMQSDQAANASEVSASQGQAAGDPQQAAEAAEKLGLAAELVDDAETAMGSAVGQLTEIAQGSAKPEDPFGLAMEGQNEALQKLLEALEILDQNEDQNQQQNQQDQQQQQDQEQQQQQEQEQQQQMNAQQLLQLIRDREAERRKDRDRRAAATGRAVDKDW